MIIPKLQEIIQKYYPLSFPININDEKKIQLLLNFLADKRNSSLGDSLVNFAYSCAKSIKSKSFTGIKVPDNVLVNGYLNSRFKTILHLTGEKKQLGNTLEALFLLVWCFNLLSLDEIILRLSEGLNEQFFTNSLEEKRNAIKAFERLFNIFSNLIFEV